MCKRRRGAGLVLGLLVLLSPVLLAAGQQPPPSTMEPPLPGAPFPAGPTTPSPSDPPTPQVTIRVRVSATAHPGKELEYRFSVQNVTAAAAHHVRVRAPVPSHCKLVRSNPEPDPTTREAQQMIWSLGTMERGGSKEITLVVVPDGTGDPECCARVQYEHGQCVRTRLSQPDLRVRLLGPTQVLLNDLPKFQIEVTNAGQREATGVVLTNTLPDSLDFISSNPSPKGDKNPFTWQLGNIPPGQTKRIECEALAKAIGSQVNKVEVKDGAGQQKQEATLRVNVVEPKLEMTLTGPHRRLLGRAAQYTIAVSNPGTAPANNVEVWSILPNKIEFVNATGGGRLTGYDLRWKLGTLPPGARQVLQVTLETREMGHFEFWVNASADRNLFAKQKHETKFEGKSNLFADIEKTPDPLAVGKTGTYTLRLINQGSDLAKKVKTVLTFPPELKILEVKGTTQPKQEGQKVIVELEALAAKGEVTVTVAAQALQPGEVRLRCEVTAEDLTSGPIHFDEPATLHGDTPPPPAPRP